MFHIYFGILTFVKVNLLYHKSKRNNRHKSFFRVFIKMCMFIIVYLDFKLGLDP